MGKEGGTEAVVDIDDRDPGGAGGEHGVEGGLAFAGNPVAGGGGNGDERAGKEAAENTGKRAFHPCDGDDGGGLAEGVEMGEDAVDSSDANIGDLDKGVPEKLKGESGFVGDGEVGGAGGDDGNVATGVWALGRRESEAEAARRLVVFGTAVRHVGARISAALSSLTRVAKALAMGGVDAFEIVGDLLRRLVLSKDDLGSALSKFAMKIEGGMTQFFERKLRELLNRRAEGRGFLQRLVRAIAEGNRDSW